MVERRGSDEGEPQDEDTRHVFVVDGASKGSREWRTSERECTLAIQFTTSCSQGPKRRRFRAVLLLLPISCASSARRSAPLSSAAAGKARWGEGSGVADKLSPGGSISKPVPQLNEKPRPAGSHRNT